MLDFHKQMIDELGVLKNVDKTIQELQELQEKLRDWKSLYFADNLVSNDLKECMKEIKEERVDVEVMLERLDTIFNFTEDEKQFIKTRKINRTIKRCL